MSRDKKVLRFQNDGVKLQVDVQDVLSKGLKDSSQGQRQRKRYREGKTYREKSIQRAIKEKKSLICTSARDVNPNMQI